MCQQIIARSIDLVSRWPRTGNAAVMSGQLSNLFGDFYVANSNEVPGNLNKFH